MRRVMSHSTHSSRFRYRLRTLLVVAPLAAWLIARCLSEPVAEVDAWIIVNRGPAAASDSIDPHGRPPGDFQATAVKDSRILAGSLEPPEIASLPIVKRQADAIRWLHDQLHVEVQPESSIIRISVRGRHPEQLSKILHSVASTYSRATRRLPR
jgi:hypothetical protein